MKTFNNKAQDSLSKEIYERVKIDFSELKNTADKKTNLSNQLATAAKYHN